MVHIINYDGCKVEVLETNVPFEEIKAFVESKATKGEKVTPEYVRKYIKENHPAFYEANKKYGNLIEKDDDLCSGFILLAKDTETSVENTIDGIVELASGSVLDQIVAAQALSVATAKAKEK